ncbi:hypothetical protein HJC23_004138 [Cyclotella cryptica]|uniref:Serine hydrolase domain-containing protein n=1 Tax=Cyclotella cryptica TaxID=29204 RepID=A0ABD3PHS5_9STRA|eukprot:CCRYP_014669-RA/>CCRYP_014669-RA protein AED:0.25 eAED:0.25 QI:0/-1/0/1/-1/1/1/0/405
MRVLCLHPEASSALQFSKHLEKLEERLWKKHGIELCFIDGPLLDVMPPGTLGGIEEGGSQSRRWYVEEKINDMLSLSPSEFDDSSPSKAPSTIYSGLDASLLHLAQIWNRGGANCSNHNGASSTVGGLMMGDCLPFQGVLGFGQGADVAAMLPLLTYHYNEEDMSDGEGSVDREEKEDMRPPIFQGLQFVIIVAGKDIMHQKEKSDSDEDNFDELYVGEKEGIQSLHIIFNDDCNKHKLSSQRLAKQYGPHAEIHHHQPSKRSSPNDNAQPTHCSPALSNIIGKYLVSQKNRLYGNSETRQLITLRNRLANVEQLATLTIAREIQRNPPKALMAVIGPLAINSNAASNDNEDEERSSNNTVSGMEQLGVGMAVGAWQGPRRRGFGEEGGGAPCPQEFLLKENERR